MAASTGSGNYDAVVQAYNANTFATISSGDTVTLTDNVTGCNFFKIEAGATLVGGGFSITIDNDSSNHSFINNGTISGVLDVIITNPNGQSNFNANGQGGNVRNLTVNNSGAVVTLYNEDQTLDGDLTITAGQLTTNDGSADRGLTVTKACDVGTAGTLNLNGSTVSLGTINVGNGASASMTFSSATTTITLNPNSTHPTWGFSLGAAATVNFNSGTIKFAKVDSGTRYMQMGAEGVHVLNDVIIDTNYDIPWASFFEAASLDIQDGNLNSYGGSDGITITGPLTVGNGSDAAALTYTSDSNGFHDQSFGGIKLLNNGTLDGSNQTMTVTNRYTGESHLWKNDGGTFNHNNGTVKFNDNDNSIVKENTFYNVEVASNLGDYAVSFEAQGGGGNAFTILNNLTITRGDFELVNADDTCDIHGETILNGSSNSGARFNNDKNQTATITHHGLVKIITGTYHVEDGATVNMAGIRNIGGLVD